MYLSFLIDIIDDESDQMKFGSKDSCPCIGLYVGIAAVLFGLLRGPPCEPRPDSVPCSAREGGIGSRQAGRGTCWVSIGYIIRCCVVLPARRVLCVLPLAAYELLPAHPQRRGAIGPSV